MRDIKQLVNKCIFDVDYSWKGDSHWFMVYFTTQQQKLLFAATFNVVFIE